MLASITGRSDRVPFDVAHFNETAVMGNSSIIAVVNAAKDHFALGPETLASAEREHSGLAGKLLTRRFGSLEETRDGLFEAMADPANLRAFTDFTTARS